MSERTAQKRRVVPTFSAERCKRCGICTHLCPSGAISSDAEGMPGAVDPEACISCRLCEQVCPDFAVTMIAADAADGPQEPTEQEELHDHPAKEPEVCHPFGACDG
jgi:2-oxoglutarate ferredoxin oxidoreductase subunit delta